MNVLAILMLTGQGFWMIAGLHYTKAIFKISGAAVSYVASIQRNNHVAEC